MICEICKVFLYCSACQIICCSGLAGCLSRSGECIFIQLWVFKFPFDSFGWLLNPGLRLGAMACWLDECLREKMLGAEWSTQEQLSMRTIVNENNCQWDKCEPDVIVMWNVFVSSKKEQRQRTTTKQDSGDDKPRKDADHDPEEWSRSWNTNHSKQMLLES